MGGLLKVGAARVAGAVALLVLTASAFAPGLWAGFVYDDLRDVVENPAAQAGTFLEQLPQTVRPLLKASYALQDATTGGNPFPFHAVNLALHLGAVLMVLALLTRAARHAGHDPVAAFRIGWIAALLWAVHPALTETVTYVSGRSVGLSSVLILGCLLAATSDRPWRATAFALALLAPLARETALAAPILLLVWQITLFHHEGLGPAVRRAAPVWLGALIGAVILGAMARHRELVAFSLDQRDPLDALRGNAFALPEILRLWLEPWAISILPAQPVVYGWGDAATLIRLSLLVAVPVAAVLFRRRAPLLAFATLWTVVALIPTNSVIWRMDPVAVRPLYLAGIALALLPALLLAKLRFGPVVGLALALWLATLTWQRATLYQDEVALFADAAAKAPDDARAQMMLGLTLANAGRNAEARAALQDALTIDPTLTEATNALRVLDAVAPVYANP